MTDKWLKGEYVPMLWDKNKNNITFRFKNDVNSGVVMSKKNIENQNINK